MSIIVNNVTKLYGEQKALDSVSININKGEIVGLLGPNGAGKTTLMKILSCYILPTDGTANVCGFDVVKNASDVKKSIGYLQENNPLYTDMYISEYLSFISGIYHLKNKKSRIEEVMYITGLMPEKNKMIRQLSKGFKQRVGLAQSLIHNPEVLILDEPTSGLDPNQIIEIRNLIKTLGKSKTVILSTHIMQEVEAICDKVVIINKGKIVADDSTKKILSTSSQIVTEIEIKKPCPDKPFASFGYGSSVEFISENENSVRILIKTDNDKDIREKLFSYAMKNSYIILLMADHHNKLEEVFIEMVGNNARQ